MKIIINADDYGMSTGINMAVYQLAVKGRLSSTSVMVNLPYWEEIVELLPIKRFGIGLHFNIVKGKPISKSEKISSIVDREGNFYSHKELIERKKKGLVYRSHISEEFKAQFQKLEGLIGHRITHVDSHHGFHNYYWVSSAILDVSLYRKNLAIRSNKHFFLQKSKEVYIVNPTIKNVFTFGPKRILKEIYYRIMARRYSKSFVNLNGNIILKGSDTIGTLNWLSQNGVPESAKGIYELASHPSLSVDGLEGESMLESRIEEYNLLNKLPAHLIDGVLGSFQDLLRSKPNV